jgi:hypothetical protein
VARLVPPTVGHVAFQKRKVSIVAITWLVSLLNETIEKQLFIPSPVAPVDNSYYQVFFFDSSRLFHDFGGASADSLSHFFLIGFGPIV